MKINLEQINKLITEILQQTISNIPVENWENASLQILALNKMIEITAFYEKDKEFKSFDPEENGADITMMSKKMREEMYSQSPNQGAWFGASFTIQNNGQFQSSFEYQEKPEFTYEPSDEKYRDDLSKFPREEGLIPDWLKEKQ